MNLHEHILRSGYQPLLETIGRISEGAGIRAFVVGGYVRDLIMRRPTSDIDVVTEGVDTGIELARLVAADIGASTVHEYSNFGTAAIRLKDDRATVLEFVAARKESYSRASRKPEVEPGTLHDDQYRRDFTINALSIDLASGNFGQLIDPFDGLADLQVGIIRTPAPPMETFDDDPLRIMRAARFASQLDFSVDADTLGGMNARADRIDIVSEERISVELNKILLSRRPSVGFKILYEADVLHRILPELTDLAGVETKEGIRHKDNFFHTLQVVDNLVELLEQKGEDDESSLWLRWAALLHDIGKPRAKRYVKGTGWTFHGHEDRGSRMVKPLFRRLRLPLDERLHYVRELVRMHHRPVALVDEQVTDSAVRRLLFDAGDAIDDLMTLVRADITSKNPRRVRKYLGAFDLVENKLREVEEKDRLRNFQPPVDGIEIMDRLGLEPSRKVGDLKEAVREAILAGKIPNEHDAALAYLFEIKDEILARYEE